MPSGMNPTKLVPPLVIMLVIGVASLVTLYIHDATPAVPDIVLNAPELPGEVVHADVVGAGLVSTEISVLGVSLGMTESQVLERLGHADRAQEFDFGAIQNWEYDSKLGLNRTGVTFHLRNGIVTRIMLQRPLNKYLQGYTSVNGSKEEVYRLLGTPDRQYAIKGGRYFVYNDEGYEIFLDSDGESALGLVFPGRKLPTTATLEGNDTPPAVPKLIIDTTTLCAQGPTFAFNLGTGACTAYENACVIPAHEVEVLNCEAESLTDDAIRAAIEASRSG
jgi:hypothetical protein